MARVKRIELLLSGLEALVLPLDETRMEYIIAANSIINGYHTRLRLILYVCIVSFAVKHLRNLCVNL